MSDQRTTFRILIRTVELYDTPSTWYGIIHKYDTRVVVGQNHDLQCNEKFEFQPRIHVHMCGTSGT